MKTLSAAMQAHIAQELTTLVTCWRIERKDGVIQGFTAHDQDIVYETVTYKASTGFSPTAFSGTNTLSVDNLDVQALLDSADISEEDLEAGLYNNADIYIFLVNWQDLTQGDIKLQRGTLGAVTIRNGTFTAEMRSFTQQLQQNIGRSFGPDCDANLGDSRCQVDTGPLTFAGSVSTVESTTKWTSSSLSQEDDYFTFGVVTFTSGNNNGYSMDVKKYMVGEVDMFQPLPHPVQSGDAFLIVVGCDRTFATCIDKFSNEINFQGFPHLPGLDKVLAPPDAI